MKKGFQRDSTIMTPRRGKISRYHVLTLGEIFGVLAVAIGAGCIIYFTISNSYKVRGKGYYYAYQQNSKVNLRVKGRSSGESDDDASQDLNEQRQQWRTFLLAQRKKHDAHEQQRQITRRRKPQVLKGE